MNKKIVFLLIFFLFSLTMVNALGETLNGTWSLPSSSPNYLGGVHPNFVGVNVNCTGGTGTCLNTTATLQYCVGATCSDYKNITTDCSTDGLCLVSTWAPSCIGDSVFQLGSVTSTNKGACWGPNWSSSFPGRIYNLRVALKADNASEIFMTGKQEKINTPPAVTLNLPSTSGTTTVVQGQPLPINWTTSDADAHTIKSTIQYYLSTSIPGLATTIYTSAYQTGGLKSYGWTVPTVTPGTYYLFVNASDSYGATNSSNATLNIIECSVPGTNRSCTTTQGCPGTQTCQANNTWGACTDVPNDNCPPAKVDILSPADTSKFYIGTSIDFNSTTINNPLYKEQTFQDGVSPAGYNGCNDTMIKYSISDAGLGITNYGLDPGISIYNKQNGSDANTQTLIRFKDLNISMGSKILEAKLDLYTNYMNNINPLKITAFHVWKNEWIEGTGGQEPSATGATYNLWDGSKGLRWGLAGAANADDLSSYNKFSGSGADRKQTEENSIYITCKTCVEGTYVYPGYNGFWSEQDGVMLNLTNSLQNQLDNNKFGGWLLTAEPGGWNAAFRSCDYGTPAQRPKLRVNWTEPGAVIEWDSNKDKDWGSSNSNFSSNGLSIGDHNITIKETFPCGPTTVIDSVVISILPIPRDVLEITSFEVLNKTNPGKKITSNDTIQINLRVTNLSQMTVASADTNLIIINAETGEEVDRNTSQKPTLLPFSGTGTDYYKDISFEVKLASGNYKIKVDSAEVDKEQNKENNHASTVISVLEPQKELKAEEVSVLIIPAILIAIIIILRKEKISKFLGKKKKEEQPFLEKKAEPKQRWVVKKD